MENGSGVCAIKTSVWQKLTKHTTKVPEVKEEGTQLRYISDHNLKVNGSVDLKFKMDTIDLTLQHNR